MTSPRTPAETLALSAFRLEPLKLNCAQAVVHAHRAAHPDCAHHPDDFRELGAGRAPEGRCGALHAARTLRPEAAEAITTAFRATAGGDTCRELKREHGFPCPECVALAVRLLDTPAPGAQP